MSVELEALTGLVGDLIWGIEVLEEACKKLHYRRKWHDDAGLHIYPKDLFVLAYRSPPFDTDALRTRLAELNQKFPPQ